MKSKILLIPLFLILASAGFVIFPPYAGRSAPQPVDTFWAPPVMDIPALDTPALDSNLERAMRKEAVLLKKTRVISKDVDDIEHQTSQIRKVVSSLNVADDSIGALQPVPASAKRSKSAPCIIVQDPCMPKEPKHNFWYRLKHLF